MSDGEQGDLCLIACPVFLLLLMISMASKGRLKCMQPVEDLFLKFFFPQQPLNPLFTLNGAPPQSPRASLGGLGVLPWEGRDLTKLKSLLVVCSEALICFEEDFWMLLIHTQVALK